MSKRHLGLVALAGLSTLAIADAASARGRGMGDGSGPVGAQCSREIGRYCSGMSHGGGAVRACLQNHRGKLSRTCKAALDGTGGGRSGR